MNRKWITAAFAVTAGVLTGVTGVFAQTTPAKPAMAASPSAMSHHHLPPRDAKGHFMKVMPGAKMGHAMPMRDAKGRFMKKSDSTMMMKKKTPMRDAKGRFMKASPASAAMPAKK
jgi:hypothetical protein